MGGAVTIVKLYCLCIWQFRQCASREAQWHLAGRWSVLASSLRNEGFSGMTFLWSQNLRKKPAALIKRWRANLRRCCFSEATCRIWSEQKSCYPPLSSERSRRLLVVMVADLRSRQYFRRALPEYYGAGSKAEDADDQHLTKLPTVRIKLCDVMTSARIQEVGEPVASRLYVVNYMGRGVESVRTA